MLLLLLSACTVPEGNKDTGTCPLDTAGEPAACATAEHGEYLYLCAWDVFEDFSTTGQFTAFGDRGVEFTAADGSVMDLGGGSTNVWVDVPDLAAAGEVTLSVSGNCGAYGGGTATVLVTALDGTLLLLTGINAGPWAVGDWTASAVDEGCGVREAPEESCSICISPRPIAVSGPATLEAWPGSEFVADGYRLVVGESYHGTNYQCADGPGDDVAYWYVVAD